MKLAGVGKDIAQISVNAEPDAALHLLRLDVHIRRAVAKGEIDNLVQYFREGTVFRQCSQLVSRQIGFVEKRRVLEFADAFFEARFGAIMDRGGVLNLSWKGKH